MSLCQPGDEAVAVGLLTEAIPDSPLDGYVENPTVDEAGKGPGDDPSTAAAASALLRKVIFREISRSVCCCVVLFVVVVPACTEVRSQQIARTRSHAPDLAATSQLFRGAISDSVALSHASFHLDGRWASLQSLRACAPPGATSLPPLPEHWLFLPLASQVRYGTVRYGTVRFFPEEIFYVS